jgi:hypothetical protein
MSDRANISSIEALEAFRAQLIVYASKVRPALEDAGMEVRRTKMWLEGEGLTHWEQQRKRRAREHEEATQAVFSAKLGASIADLRDASAAEAMRVHKARRSLDEADAKIRRLKEWNRRFDGLSGPLLKQIEKFQTLVTHDLKLAVASLTETIRIVESYAERVAVAPSNSNPAPNPGAGAGAASAGQGGPEGPSSDAPARTLSEGGQP